MSQRSKVCLITGGSSGIGLAAAVRFAQDHFDICICARDSKRLERAQQTIQRAAPCRVLALPVDLRQNSVVEAVVANTIDQLGSIDVLVNNASAASLSAVGDMDDQAFESMIDLNIRAVFYLTRAVWRQMKEQGGGIIVNISSLAAVDPFPGLGVYGATKAWLELLTVALAAQGKAAGIRVYGIRPGAVETPMLRSLFPDFPKDQTVSPQEVAETIWSVCQKGFANSSGQSISVTRQ